MSEMLGIVWAKAAAFYAWLASWVVGYPKIALGAILLLGVAALL